LRLERKSVIAHASLEGLGGVNGGADSVVRALLETVSALVMPAFTFQTMIIPEVGPDNNGITYGSGSESNRLVAPFTRQMPVDKETGIVAETLRKNPLARRTTHPLLSFAGIHAKKYLDAQSKQDPFGPIGALTEADGWVLLMGVDHTFNISIHNAEKLAGRKQFVRWAYTPRRIVECHGFPGDSSGFNVIAPYLIQVTRAVKVGDGFVQAIPLRDLLEIVTQRIKEDPLALLCQRADCERCQAVRVSIRSTD
jgi:aminoglycoside 3-N-acetyltransferase